MGNFVGVTQTYLTERNLPTNFYSERIIEKYKMFYNTKICIHFFIFYTVLSRLKVLRNILHYLYFKNFDSQQLKLAVI